MDFSRKDIADLNNNSLYHAMGIVVVEAAAGRARSILRPNLAVCWPFPGQPHGGIIYTLMDTTMAWAVISQVEPGHNCATISMEVQYTQRAQGPEFVCQARTTSQTGRMIYTQAEINDVQGRLLAMAQAVFRVIKDSKKN